MNDNGQAMKQNSEHIAPWEKGFDKAMTPFEEFIHEESASGLLLMICTVIALICVNTALAHSYEHFFHQSFSISVAGWTLEHTLHHWINDGLMALFFFVVGLEIKREVLVGELSSMKQAILPVIAAIGGMVVPALLFVLMTLGDESVLGWGIPMATDLAFAVGILVLLGKHVPRALLSFLVGLAIVDDLGGVMVIAIFYTEQIFLMPLLTAGLLLLVLIGFNRFGISKPLPYFIVGLGMWLAMMESGVHATLAGILTAWTIPARSKCSPQKFSLHMRELLDRFDGACKGGANLMNNPEQHALLQTFEHGVHKVETPLQRLEHSMHMPVAFLIIPLFALANAGIPINFAELGSIFSQPVTQGVMLGLVIGKFVGIGLVTLLAVKLGIGELPRGTGNRHMIGLGLLGGIGFTMSIFIAELGFQSMPEQLLLAKTGILFASIFAGVAGYLWLRFACNKSV